jgi:3-dehydroquinate dehydratase II
MPAHGSIPPARTTSATHLLDEQENIAMTKIVVLNGPNLNRLGKRRPERYGYTTLQDVVDGLHALAGDLDLEIVHKQSNTEGQLIDFLHGHLDGPGSIDGVLINPAGLTLYGRPLIDACGDTRTPIAVVHIAQLHKRGDIYGPATQDPWAEICDVYVCGLGVAGYNAALVRLHELIGNKPSTVSTTPAPAAAATA